MNFYNHIEVNDPLIKEFFPEFDGGKILRVMIITDLEDFDVPLLVQAQDLNEGFVEALEGHPNVNLEVEHNDRYFPKVSGTEEVEDTSSMLIGDSLMFRTEPDYSQHDFIVSQNFVYLEDEIVASVATMTINEPIPLNEKMTVH